MTRYWIKIALGAALVFAVGMLVVSVFKIGKQSVAEITEGTGPIRIPLMLVPFNLDGERLGTMRGLVILRDSAQKPAGLELSVAVPDSLAPERLQTCILALLPTSDTTGIVPTNFTCASTDDTVGRRLVQFGELRLRNRSESFPLLAPEDKVQEIREQSGSRMSGMDEAAQYARDSIVEVRQEMIDSILSAAESQQQERHAEAMRLVDSIRASLDSLRMGPP